MADPLALLKIALADRYVIERELGHGGMATVYLGRGPEASSRRCGQGPPPRAAGAIGPERFLREIEIAAGLSHPHILPLFDSGEVRRPALLRHALYRRRVPAPAARPGAAAADRGRRADHPRGRRRAGIRPRAASCTATSSRRTSCSRTSHAVVADFGIARAISAASGDES